MALFYNVIMMVVSIFLICKLSMNLRIVYKDLSNEVLLLIDSSKNQQVFTGKTVDLNNSMTTHVIDGHLVHRMPNIQGMTVDEVSELSELLTSIDFGYVTGNQIVGELDYSTFTDQQIEDMVNVLYWSPDDGRGYDERMTIEEAYNVLVSDDNLPLEYIKLRDHLATRLDK